MGAECAFALEFGADIVVKRLIPLAMKKSDKSIRFSTAGRYELGLAHENLASNTDLAATF